MPRSLAQISAANQKPKTTGPPREMLASSRLGPNAKKGIRGGGVKGSSSALNR